MNGPLEPAKIRCEKCGATWNEPGAYSIPGADILVEGCSSCPAPPGATNIVEFVGQGGTNADGRSGAPEAKSEWQAKIDEIDLRLQYLDDRIKSLQRQMDRMRT